MRNPRAPLVLLWLCLLIGLQPAMAQEAPPLGLDIQANTEVAYDETNSVATATNGVIVRYTDATGLTVLSADKALVDEKTGDIFAEGAVRIQKDNATWTGSSLHYNYQTKVMEGDKFRMGKSPVYLSGEHLHGEGEGTNGIYQGTNLLITTDDYYQPLQQVRARRFIIVPGKYVEAHDAALYAGKVPLFYFPYYRRSLEHDQNSFSFLPGYRSVYGPYLLSTYNWFINEQLRGSLHADYREARGFGFGPDVNFKYGRWGDGTFRYYYTRDHDPGTDPQIGTPIPRDRQRVYFNYNANPLTNLTVMSQVAYQSDPFIVRDFFESQYRKDIQPNTFVDVNQFWRNWSLDALAQPRVNPFWETVERVPDVRLTGFRQQIGSTPLYYESQSSIGYFRRLYADTNLSVIPAVAFPGAGDYWGTRADTFHQITLPQTYFGWLNFTPRAGGRFTYYDSTAGAGATTTNQYRGVFNTGAEVSFTASRLWSGVENHFWDVDGVRHIFQPSINYVYIPRPNVRPSQLPQFDYESTNNLRLLPLDFPDYNSIDAIDSQNTIRYGLINRLQTKRHGELDDLINWNVYMDWYLRPRTNLTDVRTNKYTFSDIYSDFSLKPRTWLTFNSSTRYSISQAQFNLAQHTLTVQPNNTWSWTVGHLYLRSGPIFGLGDNLYTSQFFYRFNENWGARMQHYFDAHTGLLQEQDYTIYRDLRSWTAALTFRRLSNTTGGPDYTVAFTFSFKSLPRFGLGVDTVNATSLVGY